MKKIPWNKGIPRTKKERAKISRGRKLAIRKYGHPRGMLGKKHTQETIEKIRSWKPTSEQRKKQVIQTRLSAQKRSKKILIKCIICKKEFWIKQGRSKTAKYCSYKCLGDSKRKNYCIDCGGKLSRGNSRGKVIKRCRKCCNEFFVGNKRWNWKGGTSLLDLHHTIEWRKWRKSVFIRDNWTCQKCNKRGNKLHPHHIKNFSQYSELRFAIDNGITFCEDCHIDFHKIYGKQNNTREQIIKYLAGDSNSVSKKNEIQKEN
uniref:HNH nuclease domain-containing protein n=1 Tax=viral metagenome TaxID=1070528 RepID=A0A6H2A452_9ZZZZ